MADNESLEFLGDAVLGFVIADMLFREFPELRRGQKSKIKASLVSTASLARQAERLALGDHLLLGRGEEKTGGRRKQALLADGYEALIAAIYLDGGIEQARAFIGREFAPLVADVRRARLRRAATSSRPCRSACRRGTAAARVPASPAKPGPDHRKLFQVEVRRAAGKRSARRIGPSKKEAEQEAARLALEKLGSTEAESKRLVDLDDAPALRSSLARRRPTPPAQAAAAPVPAAAGAAARSAAPRARRRPRSGGVGRQCSRTHRRSSGSAKL